MPRIKHAESVFKNGAKVLTREQKQARMFIVGTLLNNLESDNSLLSRIIISDERWVFEYDSSTNCQTMQ